MWYQHRRDTSYHSLVVSHRSSFGKLLPISYGLVQTAIESHTDGLVQDCGNSIANAMELPQSCTKPSIQFGPTPPSLTSHWCTVSANWSTNPGSPSTRRPIRPSGSSSCSGFKYVTEECKSLGTNWWRRKELKGKVQHVTRARDNIPKIR